MKRLFLLFGLTVFMEGSASAQTLLHEGKGVFLRTTPAVLVVPAKSFGYNLNASYSHRLSEQFDVTGGLGYSSSSASVGGSVGYTNRFSESAWGFRSGMAFTILSLLDGGQHVNGRGGVSTMLFREVALFSVVQAFPNVYINTDVLLGYGSPDLELSASIGVPVYFRVWREVRLFLSPSYRVGRLTNLDRGRSMSIGFGAQVSLPQ